MSKAALQWILPVYNFIGISSVKQVENCFRVSSFFAWLNLIKMIFDFIFMFFLFENHEIRAAILKFDIINIKSYSVFAQIIVLTSTQLVKTVSLLICIVQFLKRREIAELMNEVSGFVIDESFSRRLKSAWLRKFIKVSVAFLFTSSILYSTKFKPSLTSALWMITLVYPCLIATSFLSLVSTCKIFLVAFMQDYKNDLSKHLQDASQNDYHRLAVKHQKIVNLSKNINKTFGVQMTLLTCGATVVSTFQVSLWGINLRQY